MAEGTAPEVVDPETTVAAVDMEVESVEAGENGGEPNQKRSREEEESNGDDVSKKQKVDEEKSVEEERLEKVEEQVEKETHKEEKKGEDEEEKEGEKEDGENEAKEEKEATGPVKLGHKTFVSSVEMFNYFCNFLHAWPQNLNVNKYEHNMLLELLKKGHAEPGRKIGGGIRAFQVRYHPNFKSKCFFVIREDNSVDDFSFRKCVDHILPLPEGMQTKSDVNKALGGGGKHHRGKGGKGRGGRGGGRGHGRGGKWRH
ncbi:hypothetical protein RJT34_01321 [Clitoria ternatea]|uniref:Uncharacterized protein n=1 Tax=Clitoria ternatea TaxID=43366 RepID=A0AAN9PYH0_CLITE